MTDKRIILFIDAQNLYNGARRAFFHDDDPSYCGQINPHQLGQLICHRQLSYPNTNFILHEVRIYTGRPDPGRQPKVSSAHMRQCQAWQSWGVTVIPRMLKYPPDWPSSKPQEKGVDVALAVDFVTMAIDGKYEIGVIASTDTDLKVPLEYVADKCTDRCSIQVMAWKSPMANSRLSITGRNIWCHWLDAVDFASIEDQTRYSL